MVLLFTSETSNPTQKLILTAGPTAICILRSEPENKPPTSEQVKAAIALALEKTNRESTVVIEAAKMLYYNFIGDIVELRAILVRLVLQSTDHVITYATVVSHWPIVPFMIELADTFWAGAEPAAADAGKLQATDLGQKITTTKMMEIIMRNIADSCTLKLKVPNSNTLKVLEDLPNAGPEASAIHQQLENAVVVCQHYNREQNEARHAVMVFDHNGVNIVDVDDLAIAANPLTEVRKVPFAKSSTIRILVVYAAMSTGRSLDVEKGKATTVGDVVEHLDKGSGGQVNMILRTLPLININAEIKPAESTANDYYHFAKMMAREFEKQGPEVYFNILRYRDSPATMPQECERYSKQNIEEFTRATLEKYTLLDKQTLNGPNALMHRLVGNAGMMCAKLARIVEAGLVRNLKHTQNPTITELSALLAASLNLIVLDAYCCESRRKQLVLFLLKECDPAGLAAAEANCPQEQATKKHRRDLSNVKRRFKQGCTVCLDAATKQSSELVVVCENNHVICRSCREALAERGLTGCPECRGAMLYYQS